MKFKHKNYLLLVLSFAIIAIGAPVLVYAQGGIDIIEIKNPLQYGTVPEIIEAISGILKTIALGVGVIMIIWGGIMIITSGGSEEKLTKGKKTLMWTVIGVAIVYAVDFIIGFLKEILTGA